MCSRGFLLQFEPLHTVGALKTGSELNSPTESV